ncbi:hypothetical protein V8B55DRAFT_1394330 [Mucor lusitanicus]|uniref:SAP domain-containing protein n=1 Tax=Mucor circinelloides f. lusitanicus TaxID=29924 RepID=A0A8H4B7S5_MUCCL|nr:hypothetical protein FB192DRAFT_1462966 [Mucor lusitanicus]
MSDIKPSSLKVVELRAELSKRGLATKGKKDELVARLTEALAADESTISNQEPATEEEPKKIIEEKEAAPAVEQQQEQVTQETTTTTVIHGDTAQETVVEASKEEQLIVKPAEKVIAQPAEELIKKPAEEVIEKPAEEVIEKPAEEVIEKPAEEVIEKPAEQVIEKPVEEVIVQTTEQVVEKTEEQIIEKPDEEMIEKPQEQVIEKPDEQMIEKPQEQVVKTPDEQVIESQANDSLDADVGLKRKRLENDGPEDEKRLKTEQKTTSDATGGAASLYIKGFVRPLIIKHVQELLSKYGTVKRFWMDSIKTHCYVTYETASQAKEAFQQVNGIKFPADTGRLLTVGELTSEQADQLIDYEQNAAEKRIKVDWESMLARVMAGEATAIKSPSATEERRVRTVGINQIITKQLAQAQAQAHPPPTHEHTRSIPSPSNTTTTKPKEISLDDLFRKTKALPPLYYLPNTDQEAKLKLERLGHH